MYFYDYSDLDSVLSKDINSWFYEEFTQADDPAEADIVLCGSKPYCGHGKNKYIACNMTNVDHIDFKKESIVYLNDTSVLKNVTSTAEHTILLMLLLARNFTKNTCTKRPALPYSTLSSKTLGIIGYGRIGKQVAQIARSIGMDVFIYDKEYPMDVLYDLLSYSDYISLHTSVKPKQKPILSKKELDLIKEGSYLINTSRGGALDYEYLYKTRKRFAGIALDVYPDDETARRWKRASNYDNIIVTPHIGGYTMEDLSRTSRIVFGLLQKKLKEEK